MKRLFTIIVTCLTLSHIAPASAKGADTPADSVLSKRDTLLVPVVEPVKYSAFGGSIFQRRLDSVQKEVPLNYNEYVQSYIDIYTAPGRRSDIGRIIGLSKYYFPIYEKAFREAGIPPEIEFLSIVESALNPNAVSRVGATGPWQFMYATGRLLGLNVNNYVDERRDPIQASYAAAAYLKDAYQEFGDWLLAIASYNCGKSSVERAIDRSGGATDFWSIRPYLPSETRGYVPAYIAITYVMKYFDKHGIMPQAASFNTRTDSVMVSRTISLSNISKALGEDTRTLMVLNPCYTRGIVNGTPAAPRRLILPQVSSDRFASLYDILNSDAAPTVSTVAYAAAPAAISSKKQTYHKVRRGETLADIADEYGVAVQDLKDWNNLRHSKVPTGTRLRVSEPPPTQQASAADKPVKYTIYRVRKGDTLSGVAEKFEASIERIKALNGLKKNSLQPGMTLKIAV